MHQDRLLGLGLLLLCALGWFWLIPVYVEGDIQQVYPRAVIILIYLAYLLLIPRLGFFSCSLVAAVFFLWFLGVRKLRSLLLVPCIILICVHLLIERGLRFDLPDGLLF